MWSSSAPVVTARSIAIIYPHKCTVCAHAFEVIKSVKDIDNQEMCEKCGSPAERYIASSQAFFGANDWDTAHYSQALGRVVKNNAEARRLAKERGMIEIGNEPVEKIHKKYDSEREEKAERSYSDVVSSLRNLGEVS